MDTETLFNKGNAEFVDENYEDALELYNQALAIDGKNDEIYSNRAQVYLKLRKYQDARNDASKALELNSQNSKAYMRKGIACYYLNDYNNAMQSFNNGKSLKSDKSFDSWITKCKPFTKDKTGSSDNSTLNIIDSPSKDQSHSNKLDFMPSGVKTKFDWYQTETEVIVTILIKNVPQESISINADESNVGITIKQNPSDYSLELELAHAINPLNITMKAFKSKVEVKLKKREGMRWAKLERDHNIQTQNSSKSAQIKSIENPPVYPSSSVNKVDWDKVVKDVIDEEKNEKGEGDAALNSLFQQIYADGSDEVKKAMNKSFQESGGTVLSTNWKEIASGKVDVKPPDGMEYKEWES